MSKRKKITPIPERTDDVSLLMTLDASAYERHKEAVRILAPNYQNADAQQSDLYRVTYKFWVGYYGVVKKLQAVQEICDDPDVITAASCADLEEGRTLIYEVLKKLDNIIQQVKERKHLTCFLSRIFKRWFSRPHTHPRRQLNEPVTPSVQ